MKKIKSHDYENDYDYKNSDDVAKDIDKIAVEEKFYHQSPEVIKSVLSKTGTISTDTAKKIVKGLFNIYGFQSVQFLDVLNIKGAGSKSKEILGPLLSLSALNELTKSNDESEGERDSDGCLDIDWQYYCEKAQSELEAQKKKYREAEERILDLERQISSLRGEIEKTRVRVSEEAIEKYCEDEGKIREIISRNEKTTDFSLHMAIDKAIHDGNLEAAKGFLSFMKESPKSVDSIASKAAVMALDANTKYDDEEMTSARIMFSEGAKMVKENKCDYLAKIRFALLYTESLVGEMHDQMVEYADNAFKMGAEVLDELDERSYVLATIYLQAMRDNILKWTK